MTLPIVIILMLLVASSVAMVAHKYRLPYTVALVVTGLILSVVRTSFYPDVDIGIHLTKELLFVVLLPVLIYEAAFHLELREFLNNWKSIITLAVPGLVVGLFMVSGLIYFGLKLTPTSISFGVAVLIGTIAAAPDPVGVLAVLRAGVIAMNLNPGLSPQRVLFRAVVAGAGRRGAGATAAPR